MSTLGRSLWLPLLIFFGSCPEVAIVVDSLLLCIWALRQVFKPKTCLTAALAAFSARSSGVSCAIVWALLDFETVVVVGCMILVEVLVVASVVVVTVVVVWGIVGI